MNKWSQQYETVWNYYFYNGFSATYFKIRIEGPIQESRQYGLELIDEYDNLQFSLPLWADSMNEAMTQGIVSTGDYFKSFEEILSEIEPAVL